MLNISESLKRQREQILTDSSEELLGRHTSLLEIAIISLYNRLVNSVDMDPEQFRSGGAVLALGAFGRGLIGPAQPVPILFLNSGAFPWQQSWLDEIVHPLQEAGWTVQIRIGSLDSLMDSAGVDFDSLLGLIDARYISGSRQLADTFDKSLDSLMEGRRDELLDRLHHMVQACEARLEDHQVWLEPDLDHNPGALAQIAAIRAACRIASNIRSLEDAIFRGYLTRQEVDRLQQAEKTFARLRSLLRGLSENEEVSTIGFDEQESLAARLGYSARAGFLPVEAFMRQLYQFFHGVLHVSREFWERLLESRTDDAGAAESPADPLEDGAVVRHGKIYLHTDRYPATAGHLVHLFTLAAKHGLGFANVTRQWIQHNANALDAAAGDSMAREEFLALIRSDTPSLRTLRRFYDSGLFVSLIPELSAVHGLVQHDAFHLYPVHEHHLRTLSELKKLGAGIYEQEEPDLTRIFCDLDDPTPLYLAGLLHDVGKSSGRGHAAHGGEMIPTITRRLGLSAEESNTLQFLVSQHLLLNDSAAMRDLADEEMLAHCALIVKNTFHLDLLLLLSFADMAATGPKARQKWRDTPVLALYERIHHLLEKGEPSPEAIQERIDHIRSQVGQAVADLMDGVELEACFTQMASRYLLGMPPSTIARHLRMQWQLQHSDESWIWEVTTARGSAEITLLSLDMNGLLWRSAGILTLHGMNIIEAQVFTTTGGVTLLIFQCRPLGRSGEGFDWEAIRSDMRRLMQGKLALDYRIASHVPEKPESPMRRSPSQILIDNESSAVYTILEVYTTDRVGLLYTISRTLFELQVRIYVAKITTKVDQVADVFYIKTRRDEKLHDPEQIDEIRNALLFWLDRLT